MPHGLDHLQDHAEPHTPFGVVVNNAIVRKDLAKLLFELLKEDRGLPEEAELRIAVKREMLIIASKTRPRPVLLTAAAAVLGLLPLA